MRIPLLLLGTIVLLGFNALTEAAAQSVFFQRMAVVAPPPVRFSDGAWGDFDNDGDFDLILSGSLAPFDAPDPFTQLYRNDGDIIVEIIDRDAGTFVEFPATDYVDVINPGLSPLESVWRSALAWGDYDRDLDLDLVITGLTENGTPLMRIYENVGDGDVLAVHSDLPGMLSGDVAWGDYDNDGDLDFVGCGYDASEQPTTALYENQVDDVGAFVRREAGLPALGACSVEWGDYDGDHDLDVLLTGIASPQQLVSRVYRSEGNGQFVDAEARLQGLLFASGAWGDYDADGDLDILLSGARLTPFIMDGALKLYRNEGGAFTDASDQLFGSFENDPTPGRYQGAAAWGDFDSNGYLDFFITGITDPQGSEFLEIYQNTGNGQLIKSATERFSGGLFGDAFWGDYDSDGDLDLLTMGEEPTGGVFINTLRNVAPRSKTPPTPPDGLLATPQGNAVSFAWNPATDAQTPAPGLTYNLRVGTTPGGFDVVAPMSGPATGQRLIPRRGNAGHNTGWTLQGLLPGTYYWSVQAIDNSFSGSTFSSEGSFTISTTQTAQTVLISGYSFGECIGYCYTELLLDAEAMVLIKRSWDPEENPEMRHEEPMDPALWQRLTPLIDFDVLTTMLDRYGCPDCADGGAEWIEISQGGRHKKITFEYSDTLEPIAALLDEMRQIREQLEEKIARAER